MHNTDENGRPSPGAPMPKFGGPDYKEVCSVCFSMKITLDNSIYWKSHHDLWMEENGRRKRKLGDGKDYLGT